MIPHLFSNCSGRLPEPPAPKAPTPDTQVEEMWNGREWVQFLTRWNGEKYVIEKELSRV